MGRSISPSTVIAQHQHGGSGWNHDVSPIENLDIFWMLCKGCSPATARQQRLVSNGSSATARQHRLVSRIEELNHQQQASSPPTVLQQLCYSCMRKTGPAADIQHNGRYRTHIRTNTWYQFCEIQNRGAIQYNSTTEKHFEKHVFAKIGLGSDFQDDFVYY
jgi:hypothetical protein